MSLKDLIDFSDFTTPSEALDLFNQGVRKAFSYDSYAGKTRFVAVVLSNPIPLNATDLSMFYENPNDPSLWDKFKNALGIGSTPRRISKFTFRARILGENSPHHFLPDPCDPAYVSDNAKILKIIAMHTLFISTEDYQLQAGKRLPTRGDLVLVDLENNIFGYDLQRGAFYDVILPTDATHNISTYSAGANCVTSIAATFGAGGLPGGAGGASPGRSGLGPPHNGRGPERVIDPAQPEDALFQRIVNNDPTLWPATVTNAGGVSITSTYGPGQLGHSITSRPGRLRARTWATPVTYRDHQGVDIGYSSGTPLFAVYPGVLSFNRNVVGSSTSIAIATVTSNIIFADGTNATIKVKYMHNLQHASTLAGQIVAQGQKIAISGGNRGQPGSGGTTGAHLHFEFWVNRKWQAAHYFYRGALTDPTSGTAVPGLSTTTGCPAGQTHWPGGVWEVSAGGDGHTYTAGCYPDASFTPVTPTP